jgi:hypothetical protein
LLVTVYVQMYICICLLYVVGLKQTSFNIISKVFVKFKFFFLVNNSNFWRISSPLICFVLRTFSRKLSLKQIFLKKHIFFAKTYIFPICQNLMSLKYFHKNKPFVSHVADEFCLFRSKLKERSTFVYFRDTFRNLRIFRKQLIRTWFSRKCETKISVSTLVYFTSNRPPRHVDAKGV